MEFILSQDFLRSFQYRPRGHATTKATPFMQTIYLLPSEGSATACMPWRGQSEDDHTMRVAEIVKLKKLMKYNNILK